MATLLQKLGKLVAPSPQEPAGPARANETITGLGVTNWAQMYRPGQQVVVGGVPHTAWQVNGGPLGTGYYSGNSVVFAIEAKRLMVFSEARFQWQNMDHGRPGELFGTDALSLLEEPWPGATTRDLLAVAELDAATAGNSYWVHDPGTAPGPGYRPPGPWLARLEPGNVKILTEALVDPVSGARIGEQLLGYADITDRDRPTFYAPDEIAHYRPYPQTQWLGRSWLSSCLPDVEADELITRHKTATLRQGANLTYVVSVDADVEPEAFVEFVAEFRAQHEGPENAGKTTFVGGGADVKTVGQTWESLNLKAVQGAGETRVAAAGGIHPVVAGLSEGLSGSSLNSGNYDAAKRSTVDGTIRPLWGAFAGALQAIVKRPPGRSRLWYDDRDIPFLRSDVKDQAQIQQMDATTVRTLIDAGYEPDAVVDAVMSGQLNRLVGRHTGRFSVQLLPPGSQTPATKEAS